MRRKTGMQRASPAHRLSHGESGDQTGVFSQKDSWTAEQAGNFGQTAYHEKSEKEVDRRAAVAHRLLSNSIM